MRTLKSAGRDRLYCLNSRNSCSPYCLGSYNKYSILGHIIDSALNNYFDCEINCFQIFVNRHNMLPWKHFLIVSMNLETLQNYYQSVTFWFQNFLVLKLFNFVMVSVSKQISIGFGFKNIWKRDLEYGKLKLWLYDVKPYFYRIQVYLGSDLWVPSVWNSLMFCKLYNSYK